jgi:hypothetical protein
MSDDVIRVAVRSEDWLGPVPKHATIRLSCAWCLSTVIADAVPADGALAAGARMACDRCVTDVPELRELASPDLLAAAEEAHRRLDRRR